MPIICRCRKRIERASRPGRRTMSLGLVVLAELTTLPPGAIAADAPAATEQGLDEVIVTARRREERLQDVPAAVSVVTADALMRSGATMIGDMQNSVPNLTLHEGDAKNAVVYIRGVGQIDSLAFADPGVGIYLDDVYLGRAQGAFLDLVDVQRIEVLRGPQGTLYGRNTIGGAIKYVTTAPDDELAGHFEVTGGDYRRADLKATVNVPLVPGQWDLRASGAYLSREGIAHNTYTNRDEGDKHTWAGRGNIKGKVGDRLTVDWSADTSSDTPHSSRTPARMTSVFGTPPSTDPFVVDANFDGREDLKSHGTALTLAYVLSDALTLKSITAYREMHYDAQLDLDATRASLFGVFDDEAQKQLSEELQLSIDAAAWTGVAGLYYFQEHDVTVSGLYGPAIGLVTSSTNDQRNRSYAVYSQLSHPFAERWSITAGLRYTKEHKDFARDQFFFPATQAFPVPPSGGLQITAVDTSNNWSSVTPRVGLEFRIAPDVLTYLSASKGFKSGGFDGRSNTTAQAQPYRPETVWSCELGAKTVFADRRVTLNAALFYNDYKDMQLSSFVADRNGNFAALFTNAGAAIMKGVDLEIAARLTRDLSLNFNTGYLDSYYTRYAGPGGVDISRQRHLVNAPRWTPRLGLAYTRAVGGGTLMFNADAAYRSKTYPTVSSSEVVAQAGYSIFDASVGFESSSHHWQVLLSGHNLGDKRYVTQAFDLSDSLGYQLAYYGDPRTYAATLRYKW